jgi:hypothetical protein
MNAICISTMMLCLAASVALAGGPGHCYDPSARAGYVCTASACDGNGEVVKSAGDCAACGRGLAALKSLKHVAVVLHGGVDLVDVSGPARVFSSAGAGFYVYSMSYDGRRVHVRDADVDPDYSVENCPWPDVLVVDGQPVGDENLRSWIQLVSKEADYVIQARGVTSGIDGALAVVAKVNGEESARRVARAIEYEGWNATSNAAAR